MLKTSVAWAGLVTLATLPAASAEPRRDLHGDPLPDGAVARVGTVRLRHIGETDRVALSPDAKMLVTSATGNQPLRVWDAATGVLLREVPLPPDESVKPSRVGRVPPESPAAVTFAADAKRLHVLTQTGVLRAYDLATGTWSAPLARTAAVGARAPLSTAWTTADGTHFIFAPGVAGFTGVEVFAVGREGQASRIEDPDLVSDSGVSATAGAGRVAGVLTDGAARVWDVKRGKAVATYRPPAGVFYSVALSPDGTTLAGVYGPKKQVPTPDRRDVYLYGCDTATGKERFRVPGWDGWGLTYTPDGRRLVSFGRPDVLVADADTGKLVHRLKGHASPAPYGHSFGDGSKRVATGGYDRSAIIWDLETGKPALDFDSPRGPVIVLAFSPDGKTLFTACRGEHTGGLWEADTGKRLFRLVADGKGGPMEALFTPDGRQLVVAYGQWGATGTGKEWPARLWSTADGKLVREYGGHTNGVHRLALSADAKTLATREYDKAVRLWDLGSGKLTGQFDWVPYNVPAVLALDSAGALIGAGYEGEKGTGVADLLTGKAFTRWAGKQPQSLTLSPDGRLLAVTENDNVMRSVVILDVRSGAVIQTLTGTPSSLGLVAFSADGRTVAVTDGAGVHGDDAIHLYDVRTGTEGQTIRGHKGLVGGLAFSPDGRRLATGGWADSTALVWDLTSLAK
jgi:WD40 repeat protein